MQNEYVLTKYTQIVNKKCSHSDANCHEVLVCEAQLTDKIKKNFTQEEKCMIIENAMRVLINLVPHNPAYK